MCKFIIQKEINLNYQIKKFNLIKLEFLRELLIVH